MFNYTIEDDLELGLIQLEHAEELNALIRKNFEHIREWSAWLTEKELPIERTRTWIATNLQRFAENEGFTIGIWHNGALGGQIDYGNFNWNDRKVEIGYWLGAAFEGKGLVTNSCRILIDHAFNELNLNRIEIRCAVENRKSRKIPERLGFIQEGIAREGGWLHDHFVDDVVYSMLSSEWRTANEQ